MSDPQPVTFTVSNGYIQLPVDVDPTVLQSDQLDFVAAALPGFVPQDGHLEVILLTTFAAMCAQTAQVAAQVPTAIFSYFGQLIGITQVAGLPATALSTWTMVDTKGYTIPAGTVVAFTPSGDSQVLFTVASAVTVPAGQSVTGGGAGTLVAAAAGAFGNNLGPSAVTLIDSLAFVASVASTTVSSGGANAETQPAYLNRLSAQLQLLTPRPILPADFAALAPNTVGVTRALAIDGLNPARTVTDGASTSASTTVTSVSAAFISADVGRAITGTATLTYVDGASTAASTTFTSASAAFIATDVGKAISGGSIPAATTIASVTNGTTVVLSAATPTAATAVSFTITARQIIPTGTTIASVTNAFTAVLSVAATSTATAATLVLARLTGQARTIALGAVDNLGNALSTPVKATLQASLTAKREVNFVVTVIDPTVTIIDVTYSLVITAGASAATVQTAVTTAINAYLNPANWAGGSQVPPVWLLGVTTVRYLDLASIVRNTAGVDHINALTFGVQGTALGTADLTLVGDAPLPKTGNLTPTILTS